MNDSRGVILIVEDERHVAEPLRDRLKHEGFAVEIAVDGPSGLAAARKLHPSAIIMDIGLPGMDGKEVVLPCPDRPLRLVGLVVERGD